MGIELIGKQIAALRKARGIKQEQLADYVGVSPQAVSKWENGGVPDAGLLPQIADFFGVTIDSLFGREIKDPHILQNALMKSIREAKTEDAFTIAFDDCWDIERALMPSPYQGGNESVKDRQKQMSEDAQVYSRSVTNHGFTLMGIGNLRQYFLIVPEQKNSERAYFDRMDYPSFFKDLSDPDVFHACAFLNSRDHYESFTPALLVKNLNIDFEKSKEILITLQKYQLVSTMQIELDDDVQTVYRFSPSPAFVALLIFSRELIDPPRVFSYYNNSRGLPFFKGRNV